MGLNEFLQMTADADAPFAYAALAELSGVSSEEASGLAEEWEDWPVERVRELLVRLGDLVEGDARVEFEAVFKAGLYLADAAARISAVTGLAGCGDRSVIGRMIEILEKDEAEEARASAAMTLTNLCSLACDGKLHPRDGGRLRGALGGVLESRNETTAVRRRALEAIAVFPSIGVDGFIEAAARHEDSLMRQSALYAMGRTCNPRWLGHVIREMDSPEAAIRYEATLALGKIAESDHPQHATQLGHLEAMLDDTDLEVQVAAVTALQNIGGEGALGLLRAATGSPEPTVAGAAREALEALRAEEALLDDVSGDLAGDAATMYGGSVPVDWDDDEEYDWEEREIIAGDGEAYQEHPGEWPHNN